jgi:hypothetical protein
VLPCCAVLCCAPQATGDKISWTIIRPGGLKSEAATGNAVATGAWLWFWGSSLAALKGCVGQLQDRRKPILWSSHAQSSSQLLLNTLAAHFAAAIEGRRCSADVTGKSAHSLLL